MSLWRSSDGCFLEGLIQVLTGLLPPWTFTMLRHYCVVLEWAVLARATELLAPL